MSSSLFSRTIFVVVEDLTAQIRIWQQIYAKKTCCGMKNHHLPVFSDHFPNILHHWPPYIIGLSQHVKGALRVMKPIQQHLKLFCNKGGVKKRAKVVLRTLV